MALRHIASPLDESTARSLKAGDNVLVTGLIVTARDAAHKHLASAKESPLDLKGLVIYHCGPVAIKSGTGWKILAAGPTTSIREEPYEADIIRRFRPAAIMGKGGMGSKTLDAMKESGCVYLHATGGAAAYFACCIRGVKDVYFLDEFSQPEAMWVLEVENMPAVVTMDSSGRSLHEGIKISSGKTLEKLINLKIKPD
jgi:tartrate/fumarate subfamily iron-sulfur-dependent hydro-lyase beta chain